MNLTNNNGYTILHYISRIQPKSLYIPLLLSCGADPYIKNNHGEMAFNFMDDMFDIFCAKKEKDDLFSVIKNGNLIINVKKSRL